jgi:hypothetical protein
MANKLFNKDKIQLAFAPSSPILANYILPVNRALAAQGSFMKNFEYFNLATFEIFHECCSSFPSIAHIQPSNIVSGISKFYDAGEIDEEAMDDLVHDTVSWLIREGYLVDHGLDSNHLNVSISERGLRAINRKPSSLDSNSFKEIFSSSIKTTSLSIVSNAVVELFK